MSEHGSESRGERESAGDEPHEGSEETPQNSPGGGPKRVVSKKSVDDILASLDDTDNGDPSPAVSRTSVAEPTTHESTHEDTDSSGETNDGTPVDDTAGDPATDAETVVDEPTEDSSSIDGEAASDTQSVEMDSAADPSGSVSSESMAGSASGSPSADEDEPTTDDESRIDAGNANGELEPPSEPTLPDEDGSESDAGLADRIDRGSVTGADVRAAEAADGREATPDIDEIELSLDDLEGSQSGSTTTAADRGSDAGPLAGTLDTTDDRDADDSTEPNAVARAGSGTRTDSGEEISDDSGDASTGGIVGRIRRFFSS
ncbi:hypothetical protein ACLI4Y_17240 [Natrialbaceae archaeon A-CW3]